MSPVRSHSPSIVRRVRSRRFQYPLAVVSPLTSRCPTVPGRHRGAVVVHQPRLEAGDHLAARRRARASPGRLAMKSCSASVEPTTSTQLEAEAIGPGLEQRGGSASPDDTP